jgi:hypothetical protein
MSGPSKIKARVRWFERNTPLVAMTAIRTPILRVPCNVDSVIVRFCILIWLCSPELKHVDFFAAGSGAESGDDVKANESDK